MSAEDEEERLEYDDIEAKQATEALVDRLNNPLRLYDRDRELQILDDALYTISCRRRKQSIAAAGGSVSSRYKTEIPSTTPTGPALVLVTGGSGVGKSCLVEQAATLYTENCPASHRPLIVSGKFDQQNSGQPYSALIGAFSELSDQLQQHPNYQSQLKPRLDAELSADIRRVLEQLVPSLGSVLATTTATETDPPEQMPDLGDSISPSNRSSRSRSGRSNSSNSSEQPMAGNEARNRFNFAFRKLVRAIARPTNPLVMVTDDLQWADEATLQLITRLLSDFEKPSILLIGCYRKQEVEERPGHPLHMHLREWREIAASTSSSAKSTTMRQPTATTTTGLEIQEIILDNWNRDLLELMLQDLLLLPPFGSLRRNSANISQTSHDRSCDLTNLVWLKTNGNPFFVSRFLKHLIDCQILMWDSPTQRWSYRPPPTSLLESLDLPDNVVDLLANKIRTLPQDSQYVLRMAACLGTNFDDYTLKLLFRSAIVVTNDVLLRSSFCGLSTVLKMATAEGFITRRSKIGYKFVHDRVADAAYSLIPVEDRAALHWKIGMLLSKNASGGSSMDGSSTSTSSGSSNNSNNNDNNNPPTATLADNSTTRKGGGSRRHKSSMKLWALVTSEEMDRFVERMLFVAVNQLNLGSGECLQTNNTQQRDNLIRLNIKAGEKARQSAAFVQAERYFLAGLELLPNDDKWSSEDCYPLTLRLYSNLAETKVCNGDFENVEACVDEVLTNAVSLLDKLRVYSVRIKCLGAQFRVQEAIDAGLETLSKLGEPFPSKVSTVTVVKDMLKTKTMLLGKSDDTLRGLSTLENKVKDAAMKILCEMLSFTYMCRPVYVPLVAGRLMQITLKHGASKESAFAFATHALILSGVLGDYKSGHRFAGLALFLVERFQAREWFAHVYAVVFTCCVHWVEHGASAVTPLLKAHRVGMASGDIEYGCWCAYFACKHKFFSGRPLVALEDEMRGFYQLMKDQNQETPLSVLATQWQAVLNLRGHSENPLELTGEAMDQQIVVEQAEAASNSFLLQRVYLHRLWLAYLLGDIDLASEMAEKTRNSKDLSPGTYEVIEQVFYDGLTSASAALTSRTASERKQWQLLYKEAKSKMKKWSKVGPQNCNHKYSLLQAEELSLKWENTEEKHGKIAAKYQMAIVEGRKQGYIQDTAIAYERLGEHYIRLGRRQDAEGCMMRAYSLFKAWGAAAKQFQLEQRFPVLCSSSIAFDQSTDSTDYFQDMAPENESGLRARVSSKLLGVDGDSMTGILQ